MHRRGTEESMFWLEDCGVQDWNELRVCQIGRGEGEVELRVGAHECMRASLVEYEVNGAQQARSCTGSILSPVRRVRVEPV